MLSSRLFWRLFCTYAVLTLLTATVLAVVTNRGVETGLVDQAREKLYIIAILVRNRVQPHFAHGRTTKLQSELLRLSRDTSTRLTLFDAGGTLLADSETDGLTSPTSAAEPPEIVEARSAGYGLDLRADAARSDPMMYVALRAGPTSEHPVGFVRLAESMRPVNARIWSIQRRIWATTLSACLVLLGATYLVVSPVVHPLPRFVRAAKDMARGDLVQHIDLPNRDELGMLAGAFNEMSREVSKRIEGLELKARQLEDNSERLGTVLGGMVEGVIAVDARERILFVNPAARSLLDFAGPELVGRPIWESVRSPKIHEVVRTTLSGGNAGKVELELPRSRSVAAVIATRLPGLPCPGAVLVLHDVTELRRLENIRREFVSNVSHELKTPLTSIQACAETLLNGALDDPEHNRAFVQRIEEHAERLHSLILDLLRLARIETGEAVFDLVPVPLGPAVELCLAEHAEIAQSKGVTLAEAPAADDLYVIADAEGLRTILDNLVDNAIKYTPPGGRVTVCWRPEGGMAVLEVQDTGVGIAKEHQARIFERFYRIDRARSREQGGTGLGLAIVKHLSQVFGGSVTVRSDHGRGSTFSVRLPRFIDS